MPSSTDLRRQAARCLRIAASFQDQSVVQALVAMADEFSAKADEIDPSLRSGGRVPAHGQGTGGPGLSGE
jgi:N-acetylmuramic acid 6-phosphate (MurNAc-6-P) etherase